ncbi:MAG: hypothetical protein Ct9H90mP28_4330 [Paracoccaceae bacterium]|nr:MAG: hypothetical protein Ct9H90mP28_4330 [Paracoccaceae bacterium]
MKNEISSFLQIMINYPLTMNFLKALKQNAAPIVEINVEEKKEAPYVETEEESYKKNVTDSVITNLLPELQDMCNDFVNDTLLLKYPLLMRHHTGYENFVVKMMNLFEESCELNIEEKIEEESEEEDDLDPNGLISYSK